jgi:serine/threonine-protein kinase
VHGAGQVHRDVKPQNVMLADDGRIVLMDFGAAGLMRVGPDPVSRIRGTPVYLAPEVLRGEAADQRSDVWSLGIVLYELTTGRRLFKERSDYEVLQKIVAGELPRPTDLMPDYPPAIHFPL